MKKTVILFGAFCILFTLFSTNALKFPNGVQASSRKTLPVYRLSGPDRYGTAAAVSREGWKTSEYAVLACADGDDKFADALAGSPLAYALGSPILLTERDELNTYAKEEITRLNVKNVFILGGTEAVSSYVEKQLVDMGIQVERISGTDRYDTAVKIAGKIRERKHFSKLFLTCGSQFQYAMMISPYASRNGIPIIFSEKSSLSSNAADAIREWGIQDIDIIGDINSMSQSVEDSLRIMGVRVNRLSGSSISEMNINIMENYKMGTDAICAARDDLFADGISGVPFAALKDMNIILTGVTSANSTISDFIHRSKHKEAYVFGGAGGISDYIITLIRRGNTDAAVFGNTTGNINNGGFEALYDGWIYYTNVGQDGKLYKRKVDGTGQSQICSDVPVNINVVGEWVYYINIADNLNIYKVKTDGTCRCKLNDEQSTCLTVMDNWIYYINLSEDGHIYKIATDGTYRTRLNDERSRFMSVGWDSIYYVNIDDGNTIYRIKTDNPQTKQKLNKIHAFSMEIADGIIYFSNGNDNRALYKMNIDGTGINKLSSDTVYGIHTEGGCVYFIDASDNNKPYKISADGTNKTRLFGDSAYLLNIIEGSIFFFNNIHGFMFTNIKNDGVLIDQRPSSGFKDYINRTIEVQTESGSGWIDEGEIKWITVLPGENGIRVSDAYKKDNKKIAFLTFDDGPSKNVTPAILDILKENNIKATFFMVGRMAKYNSDIVKRVYNEGHTIANHSYSHEYSYLYYNLQNFMGEVNDCESVLQDILGRNFTTRIFRFPGGSFGNTHASYKTALNEHGYEYINWNVSIGDADGFNVPVSTLMENLRQTSYGQEDIVVLMHDLGSKTTTVKALPGIIEYLKSKGYIFKKLI